MIKEEIISGVKRPKAECKSLSKIEREEIVVNCESIPNCEESVNLNQCDKCNDNYSIYINDKDSNNIFADFE